MKKRRVWWFVCTPVVAFALFAAIAFFIHYNSTDARIERAVAQIVEEYRFDVQDQMPGYIGGALTGKSYSRAPVSIETESKIVAILRAACPSYEYELRIYDKDSGSSRMSLGEQTMEAHIFTGIDRRGGVPPGIMFVPDDKGIGRPNPEPTAEIAVLKLYRTSLWQRIKEKLPW